MKQIGRKELIELIKSIPSRSYTEKPVLIFQERHTGVSAIIRKYHKNYSDLCNYMKGNIDSYDGVFLKAVISMDYKKDKTNFQWCLDWKNYHKKPVIVQLEKNEIFHVMDEDGEECPWAFKGMNGTKTDMRMEQISDLVPDVRDLVENEFEIYDYVLTQQDWLEWATEKDQDGNPNVPSCITDFLKEHPESEFPWSCGRLIAEWDRVHVSWPIDSLHMEEYLDKHPFMTLPKEKQEMIKKAFDSKEGIKDTEIYLWLMANEIAFKIDNGNNSEYARAKAFAEYHGIKYE